MSLTDSSCEDSKLRAQLWILFRQFEISQASRCQYCGRRYTISRRSLKLKIIFRPIKNTLSCHQWGSVALTLDHICRKCSYNNLHSRKCIWNAAVATCQHKLFANHWQQNYDALFNVATNRQVRRPCYCKSNYHTELRITHKRHVLNKIMITYSVVFNIEKWFWNIVAIKNVMDAQNSARLTIEISFEGIWL